jgi:hypothetical protein
MTPRYGEGCREKGLRGSRTRSEGDGWRILTYALK